MKFVIRTTDEEYIGDVLATSLTSLRRELLDDKFIIFENVMTGKAVMLNARYVVSVERA